MIRGTTPYFGFSLPLPYDQIDAGFITFSQNGTVVLDRENDTWIVEDRKASIHLTQEETLSFNADAAVEIQLAIKTTDGEVMRSNIKRTTAERILKNEAI